LSPAASYPVLVLGSSALHCPLLIFAFAMPILIANTWFLRGGAPSKLGITGFIAGDKASWMTAMTARASMMAAAIQKKRPSETSGRDRR
ncbi:NrsF family protein, partial [Rhizobium ruizarguesonis]